MSPFKDDGFFAVVNAEVEDRHGRLTYVPFD
jgi:hypothetical protein